MIELASNTGDGGIMQKDIAERQNLSNKFLDRIIAALKAAGLIVKLPGRKSGYKLTIDPSQITVYQVYRAFEPEMSVHHCLLGHEECPDCGKCGIHVFFEALNDGTKELMQSFTIQQLAAVNIVSETAV